MKGEIITLLQYLITLAADRGYSEAMKVIILHYGNYMTSFSIRIFLISVKILI